MFHYGMQGGQSGFWMAPAALGVVLILVGILLFVWPELLAFVVAAVFVSSGIGLLGSAWRLRERVTYRRMDGADARDDAGGIPR